jgi:hypothetical protein
VLCLTVHATFAPRATISACCAGVIPFIALSPPIAASLPLLPAELVQNVVLLQVAYGASIASFLGGIHWAMAMAEYGGISASEQTVAFHVLLPRVICGNYNRLPPITALSLAS